MGVNGMSGALAALLFVWSMIGSTVNASESALWQALASGNHIGIMRHAIAPGIGDPPNFALDDCSTQRNLSDTGREQAQAIGKRLRQAGVTAAGVYTSQWCRCQDTAKLLEVGPVSPLPVLNSFFENREDESAQTDGLKEWLHSQPLDQPLILVTHQVNITALTGVYPNTGEIVVLRRSGEGEIELVGRLTTSSF